jgi:hypothetical protein
MTEHFGHLVKMPSGISRLRERDAPIFGFLKEVGEVSAFEGDDSGDGVGSFFLVKIGGIKWFYDWCKVLENQMGTA